MDISVDTTKLIDYGNDIVELVAEYKETIKALYERLEKMPTTTLEWTGSAAVKFVQTANVERISYDNLGNVLMAYGKNLVIAGERIERAINDSKF